MSTVSNGVDIVENIRINKAIKNISFVQRVFSKKENQILRGVELSINHVRGISEGFVFAKAVPIHMGRTMQLWKISIIDENNRDISFAKLTTLTIDK